jgi:hypothetical protein
MNERELPAGDGPVDGKVRPGDIWKKAGPCDAVKVVRVRMPDCPDYDGGAPGCSVRFSDTLGRWKPKTWFYPAANSSDFARKMAADWRSKA